MTKHHDLANAPRVLIVEDGVIMARDIQRRVEKMGFVTLGPAYSGEEAISRAEKEKPDLILMDVNLRGGTDGILAAERIRKARDVPVVYVTAYSDEATVARVRSTNPYGLVLKPFEERELRTTIEMALYRHSIEQRLKASEERYRVIAEVTSDFAYALVFLPGGGCAVDWVTDSFARVTGLEPEALCHLEDFVHAGDRPAFRKRQEGLLAGRSQDTRFRIVGKGGVERWFHDHARPMWDPGHKHLDRILGAAKDITELVHAEEHQRQRDRESSPVAEDILRHISVPLAPLAILLKTLGPLVQKKTSGGVQVETVDRMQWILSLAEELYRRGNPARLPLGDLVSRVARDTKRTEDSRGVRLQLDVENVTVELDQALACGIITRELVANACRHAFAGRAAGTVRVRVHTGTPGMLALVVEDDGNGLKKGTSLAHARTTGFRIVSALAEVLAATPAVDNHDGISISLTFLRRA